MTALGVSLDALDRRFRDLAESGGQGDLEGSPADQALRALGLVDATGDLTDRGHDYFVAAVVRDDREAAAETLGVLLQDNPIVAGFCGTLWGSGDIPVAGALSLLKRLSGGDDVSSKRWLELMNRGRLIAYNRKHPTVKVSYNPNELLPPTEEAQRERNKAHAIRPETPFGNLLALRDLLRFSDEFIYWYEQHMDAKVLEVLYRELPAGSVSRVCLLSGPANVDADAKAEFRRFQKEMKSQRGIEVEWRVLSKKDAQMKHDRLFFSKDLARNLPPLNLILRGSTGEILPSDLRPDEFEGWWKDGAEIASFVPA